MMKVSMESDEFGYEEFGDYDTYDEACAAINRLKSEARRLKDGIVRRFAVIPDGEEQCD
jgi:hypothetical protein